MMSIDESIYHVQHHTDKKPETFIRTHDVGAETDDSKSEDSKSEASVHLHVTEVAQSDPWQAGKQEWRIVACLCVVSLVVALDATILVPALPTIANTIKASTLSTYWIGTSYLLTHAVVQPVISALSDIFGRRSSLLASVVFFTAGSLIACLAHGPDQMLVGRVIQGIGGGGIVVMTEIIITDIVPLRQRAQFLAFPQLSWAIGTVSGPLIGGAFAQSTSWRWIFYLNFPICGIGLAMVPFVVRYRPSHGTIMERMASVNWFVGFIFTTGIVSFLMAISWGGVQFAWNSYQTLVPLIVGLATVIFSLVWDTRFAKQPFLRLSIYNNRSAVAALTCTLLQGFLLYYGLYYLAFYFLSVKEMTPVMTGVAFLPLTLSLLPSSIVAGQVISRTGRFQRLVWVGWAMITLGNGVMILLGTSTETVQWVVTFIIAGIGQGVILTGLIISVQASVESKYAVDACALYTFVRSLGMALGVGIGGAAFQNRLSFQLSSAGLPASISQEAEAFVQILHTLPAAERAYIFPIIEAFARAFKNLFELSTAVAALGLLVSFLVRQSDMDVALESKHVLHRDLDLSNVADEEAVEAKPTKPSIEMLTIPCF